MTSQVVINDVLPKTQATATSGQTVFDTNWTANAESDILVYARASGVEPDDATQLISSSEYSVTFVGSSRTVRVTFSSGRTTGDVVTIIRDTPDTRDNLYTNTNFTPSMLNQDFGIRTLIAQQNDLYNLEITPHYNTSATIQDFDLILPILGANQIWAMNPAGDEIIVYDVPSSGSLAPGDATYLVQTADADLPNAQAMGALDNGVVVNTTTTGVQSTRVLTGTASQVTISNGDGQSGNPTFSISDNPIIPGTESMIPPKGTTAQRPSSPVAGQYRYNTDLNALEVYEGSDWDPLSGGVVDTVSGTANQIDVDSSDAANPVLSLSATMDLPGTFTIQSTIALDSIIDDDTLATATDTNIATAESIKAYVDSRTDLTYMEAVLAASIGNFTSTYSNGSSGVGATLTSTSNGAFSLDGEAGVLNGRYLMKDQSTTYENGIYTLTQVGDGSNPAILTRATDFDQPSEIDPGDIVPVLSGTVNGSTAWIQTATVNTIGTDAIVFSQWSADFSNVVTIDGTQTITGTKTFSAALTESGATPQYRIQETDQAADGQNWIYGANGGVLYLGSTASDAAAGTRVQDAISVTRSGTSITGMSFSIGGVTQLTMDGTDNQFFTPLVLPSGPLGSGYSIDIYTGSSSGAHNFTVESTEMTSGTFSASFGRLTNTSGVGYNFYRGDGTATLLADITRSGLRLGGANSRVSSILDEDNMVSDSATALATQQSIKAYVDAAAANGGFGSMQVFTSGGTWNKPSGLVRAKVYVTGGGGGGAGGDTNRSGGAGGAGGTSIKVIAAASLGSTETVTIGAAGSAGAAAGAGGAGGTSSFGAHATATGGDGAVAVGTSGTGGAGGVGASGNINLSGQGGGAGNSGADSTSPGSSGGTSFFGGGSAGIGASAAGLASGNYGGGGGGGKGASNGGAAGTAGIVVVEEYF